MQSSSCAICIGLLAANDDIMSTICGHVFHVACLHQWLERSKNCPQCRAKLTKDKIHRLYFNFNNNESIKEDPASLQMRLDNMQFQLDLKAAQIKNAEEKSREATKQSQKLRQAVTDCEHQLRQKESAIAALKEQAKYLKNMADERDVFAAKYQSLESQIDEYQTIQKLLTGDVQVTEEIATITRDPDKLGVYLRALKAQMNTEIRRRRQLSGMVKTMKEDIKLLVKEKKEIETAKTELEMDNDALEKANKDLRKKLYETPNLETDRNNVENDAISIEVPPPKRKKLNISPVKKLLGSESEDEENAVVHIPHYKITSAKDDYKKSSAKDLPPNSILRKKPRLASNSTAKAVKQDHDMVPDGMGGYEKIEVFPTTRLTKSHSPPKISLKRKMDETKNRRMDGFIDLTLF